MAFCPKCGNKVNDCDQFCVKCGNALELSTAEGSAEKGTNVGSSAKRTKSLLIIAICILVICAVIAVAFFIYTRSKNDFSDNPAAIAQASKSVVLLECYNEAGELHCTGSAFAAFEEGVFVTNYHVVEQDVYSIIAKAEDGTMFEIDSILAFEPKYDIAIIKTKANPDISPLPIGSSADLEKGEKIVAIGSPLGLLNTVSTGVFGGYNDTGSMNEIQFSASISHGSSGGALLNNAGEVIGITSASYAEGQNLNVAVPIQYAIDIKVANSTEMTVSQFYDTFDHYNEYIVADLLQNKKLAEERASVYGLIADIKEHEIVLVSNEEQIAEYQRLLSVVNAIPETPIPKTSEKNTWEQAVKDWENASKETENTKKLSEAKAYLNGFEEKNAVYIYDESLLMRLESRFEIGDAVRIIATINPVSTGVRKIFIRNEEEIVLLTK